MDIKTALRSLMMLGIVAALVGGATYAVFSDTEESVGNEMIAGTIDFSVDGDNPWTDHVTWSAVLDDMKPGVIKNTDFDITNVGVNPMYLYKKLDIKSQVGGVTSEPECVEGGGVFDGTAYTCGGTYTERCNLAAYTLYDMEITIYDAGDNIVSGPTVLIATGSYVRLDNVNGAWMKLGDIALEPTQYMTVKQNYVLSSWPDAAEPTVTNWAQGDILTFDITLYGEQITGTGPTTVPGEDPVYTTMTLEMVGKNPKTWDPVAGASGSLVYNIAGPEFVYTFTGSGLDDTTEYELIYYADGWPGDNPGALIGAATSDGSGGLTFSGNIDLNMDLPHADDANFGTGAKIWLVPASDYDEINTKMVAWSASTYLFEVGAGVNYDDTDV